MATLLAVFAIILYLASTVRLYVSIGQPSRLNRPLVLGLGSGAVLCHFLYWLSVIYAGTFSFGFFMVGSLITFVIGLMFILSALKKPIDNLLLGVFPMTALVLTANILIPSQAQPLSQSLSAGIISHIVLSILAYSVLTIAAFQAILLMIQDHHLKHKHIDGIMRVLPPLQTMERLLFEILGFGTLLLTLAIASGFLFLENFFAQHLLHKTVLTLLSWATFSFLLFAHWRFGWRGSMASKWTLVGTGFLVLAYFGSKFVLEIILGRA